MRNLAQRRAASAIGTVVKKGQGEGNVLSGFPMLIRIDGLLASLAFAIEKNDKGERKHKGGYSIAEAIARHLKKEGIVDADGPDALAAKLAQGDATLLRRATAETLAFLSYLKRLAKQDGEH